MRFASDWIASVDFDRMRRARLDRVRASMEAHGLDAVVAFEYANGRYIAGLRPLWAPNFMLRQAAVVTTKSDRVICMVHLDDAPHRRKTMSWLPEDDIRPFPTGVLLDRAPAEALAPLREAVEELGFTGGRVGVDIWTPTAAGHLGSLLPNAEIVDANSCMYGARSVKNRDEVELMRWASKGVDAAMAVAIDCARQPGIRECEILAEVMRVFYRFGAEVPQCNLVICAGENTAPMQRFAGDAVITYGDLVFMDIGACFNGVFSEATRTVVCGEPNDRQGEIYRHVHDLHMAIVERLRPGTTATEIQEIVRELHNGSPFDGHMQKMVIVHGIGVGYAEPPYIAPPGGKVTDLVLEPGMTLAVVPTIIVPGVPGGGGVRLEDVIHVAEDGPEWLTKAPFDDRLLA